MGNVMLSCLLFPNWVARPRHCLQKYQRAGFAVLKYRYLYQRLLRSNLFVWGRAAKCQHDTVLLRVSKGIICMFGTTWYFDHILWDSIYNHLAGFPAVWREKVSKMASTLHWFFPSTWHRHYGDINGTTSISTKLITSPCESAQAASIHTRWEVGRKQTLGLLNKFLWVFYAKKFHIASDCHPLCK